ncbi:lipid-A-disaccharide synthase [bacterium BMS3Abin14]|nr:lipid-A-disaccharide synthase [bacterium BMS3Abin14]
MMVVAGEASGDMYGGRLCASLKEIVPEIELFGVGGDAMAQSGVALLSHISELSVMGTWDVLKNLGKIRGILNKLKERLNSDPPSGLIVIDFPGFNLRLAGYARKRGIPVVYYVPPKLWVWGKWRMNALRRSVDMVLAIFPFEEDFYRAEGVPVAFVGNPIVEFLGNEDPDGFRSLHSIDGDTKVIALLPGSRPGEIRRLLPIFLESAGLISSRLEGGARFLLPLAHTVSRPMVERMVEGAPVDVEIVEGQSREVLAVSDAAVVASGTATLEAFLLGTPQAVAYRMSPLSHLIGKLVIKVPMISLPNILAGKEVVRELLQDSASPKAISDEIVSLLDDKPRIEAYRTASGRVMDELKGLGTSRLAARATLDVFDDFAKGHQSAH